MTPKQAARLLSFGVRPPIRKGEQPMTSDDDALVSGWITHTVRSPHDDEYFWAWNTVYEIVRDDPERAWPIILKLYAQAPSELVLANIAAGPLEKLLCEHGPATIDRVLKIAKKDYRFRRTLRGVWGWSRMPEKIRARIDEVVKGVPPW
jgi:hypothetical protein